MSAKIDGDRLRFELARRGSTQGQLARDAGVSAETISRALNGRGVRTATLSRLAAALLAMPVHRGADLLIAEPIKKTADAITSSSAVREEEVSRASGQRSAS